MSAHISIPSDSVSVTEILRRAIIEAVDDAQVDVSGGNGHYSIRVVSSEFEGKTQLECQQQVYRAIAPWMAGDTAPVHAVDRLTTRAPSVTLQSAGASGGSSEPPSRD